jgi:hypothetical protein
MYIFVERMSGSMVIVNVTDVDDVKKFVDKWTEEGSIVLPPSKVYQVLRVMVPGQQFPGFAVTRYDSSPINTGKSDIVLYPDGVAAAQQVTDDTNIYEVIQRHNQEVSANKSGITLPGQNPNIKNINTGRN